MNIAETFLYYADDCTDDSIFPSLIEAAEKAINLHHSDWTADTALFKGNEHYIMTICNDTIDFNEAAKIASDSLNIHSELHNVLMEYLHYRYSIE